MKSRWHNKAEFRKRHSKRRHSRLKWGLRRRLTFMFAFVALAAVMLTTWLTLDAVFNAQRDLFDLQLQSQNFNSPNEVYQDNFKNNRKEQNNHRFPNFRFRHNPIDGYLFETASAAFRQITRTAFLAALLSFILASIAAAALTRFLTRPLLALTDGAKRLEAGERNIQLKVPSSKDELGSLTEAFNNMATGLERQETWRRNMVADVAHDLRTPLAVLRSEVEAMQDGITASDAEGLERLHNEIMRMAGLVTDLKTLSSAESGVFELQKEAVNIKALLLESIETFNRQASEAQSTIILKNVIDASVNLDKEQINRVLTNLIDNALRYASPCKIEISAQDGDEGILLSVRDTGQGIPEEMLEQIFERFYRGDTARTKEIGQHGSHGSGLGLNIAKAITEAHGGSIQAYNHLDGGAVFELLLPY